MKFHKKMHCRGKQKNPFMGEEFLVYGKETDTSIDDLIQSGPVQESNEFNDILNGLDQNEVIAQFHSLQNNLGYFRKIRKKIQSGELNVADALGRNRAGKIASQVEELQRLQGAGFNIADETIQSFRGDEVEESGVLAAIDTIENSIIEQRNNLVSDLEVMLTNGFDKRLSNLQTNWRSAPEAYNARSETWVQQLQKVRDDLPGYIDGLGEMDERYLDGTWKIPKLQEVSNIIENEEARFKEYASNAELKKSVAETRAAFDALKEKKRREFDPVLSDYIGGINQSISEVDSLIAAVSSQPGLDEDERKKELFDLKKVRESFVKNLNIASDMDTMFYSNTPFTKKNPNDPDGPEIPEEFTINGKKRTLPQGIEPQIAFLESGDLEEERVPVITNAINDGIEKASTAIDQMRNDLEEKFPKILDNIKTEKDSLGAMDKRKNYNPWKITWMTPRAYWHLVSRDIPESMQRSYTRLEDKAIGEGGAAMTKFLEGTSNIPWVNHLDQISGDLNKKVDTSEQERVQNYKDSYKSRDPWAIQEIARVATNADQLKACIELLSEKGWMDWTDPAILERFNKLQNRIWFDTSKMKAITLDRVKFHENVRQALGQIWGDYDMFMTLNNQNESAYNSAKEKYLEEFKATSRSTPGGLSSIIIKILKDQLTIGADSKPDPARYEAAVEFNVIDGGYAAPEDGLYHLIQGVAHGLLTEKLATTLIGKMMNDYPAIEIFNTFEFEDYVEIAKMDTGANGLPVTYEAGPVFKRWYHSHAMASKGPSDRLNKSMSGGKPFDHDLVWLYLPYVSDSAIEQQLRVKNDGSQLEETAIQSTTVSHLDTLENVIENFDMVNEASEGEGHAVMQNIIANFVRWDSILEGRMYRKENTWVRWTDTMRNTKPRNAGKTIGKYFRSGDDSRKSNDFNNKTREYLSLIDERIFSMVFQSAEPSEAEVAELVSYVQGTYHYDFGGNPPKTMDDVFKGFSGLIGHLISQEAPGVQAMMARVKEDHRKHNAAVNAIGGKTTPQLVDTYEAQLQAYRQSKGQRTVNQPKP